MTRKTVQQTRTFTAFDASGEAYTIYERRAYLEIPLLAGGAVGGKVDRWLETSGGDLVSRIEKGRYRTTSAELVSDDPDAP